jgi:hypothetical protein
MKKILFATLAVALIALTAPVAMGAGLDLAWNNCATTGGAADVSLPCAGGLPLKSMYGSFSVDAPVTGFAALDFFIDIEVDDPGLPTFWQFNTATSVGCNGGLAITQDFDPAYGGLFCPGVEYVYGDYNTGGFAMGDAMEGKVLGYVPNQGGAPNRGRVVGSIFRRADNTRNLNAATNYLGLVLAMNSLSASERGGSCNGCLVSSAWVWNQANIGAIPASQNGPESTVVVTGPGAVSNCATTGGGNSLCGATPTQSKSWGALKSLYR